METLRKELDLPRNPIFFHLDITSKANIEKLREHLLYIYGGLDILINNAAVAFDRTSGMDENQLEHLTRRTIQTNYYGTQMVSDILFPLLRPNARVVFLSDAVGMLCYVPGSEIRRQLASPELDRKRLDQLVESYVANVHEKDDDETKRWPPTAYSASKVFLTALCRVMQKELDMERPQDGILVNACHPGDTDTDLTHGEGELTPSEAAKCPVYLALLPEGVQSPKGQMVWKDGQPVDWVNDEREIDFSRG